MDAIARLRRFNRVVTREIGALDNSYLGRGRPLSTARILHMIGPQGTDVAVIRQTLGFDSGLLSRLLRGLEAEGLVQVKTDPIDRRRRIADLTPAGQTEWQVYEDLGNAKARQVFDRSCNSHQSLIDAMHLIVSEETPSNSSSPAPAAHCVWRRQRTSYACDIAMLRSRFTHARFARTASRSMES